MKPRLRIVNGLLAAALMAFWFPSRTEAKSYSSGGGHSYSSSSSHSSSSGGSHSFSSGSHSSSGQPHFQLRRRFHAHFQLRQWSGSSTHSSSSGSSGSKSFSSGSGKSYSSGSSGSDSDRHGYSSAKSYTSGSGSTALTRVRKHRRSQAAEPARKTAAEPKSSALTFDDAAARARKEEASKQDFTRFKESQNPPKIIKRIRAPRLGFLSGQAAADSGLSFQRFLSPEDIYSGRIHCFKPARADL